MKVCSYSDQGVQHPPSSSEGQVIGSIPLNHVILWHLLLYTLPSIPQLKKY